MHFLDNPFFILNAKPCDNDARIMERADECGLLQDSNRGRDRCREAKAILMHARKRIDAEIAWLPVKTREQARKICELLESSEANIGVLESLRQVEGFLGDGKLIPIAKCNVLAAGLRCPTLYSPDEVARWTLEIVRAYKGINYEQVSTVINANREKAEVPIANLLNIKEALLKRRVPYYHQAMKSAMAKLSITERAEAMTRIVESAIADDNQLPQLITALGASYERDEEVLESLREHDTKVCQLAGQLQLAADPNRPDSKLEPLVKQLIQEVKDWVVIAQPIQLIKTSQGASHDESETLARRVENLAMHLFDSCDKLNLCLKLIKTLQDAFAEVNNISNRLSRIMDGLNDTAQERERCARRRIESQIKDIRASANNQQPDSDLSRTVNQVVEFIKYWKTSAQLCKKYYADFYIKVVTDRVKELADHLRNEHDELDVSRQLFEMLREEFAQSVDIAAREANHLDQLDAARSSQGDIAQQVSNLQTAADEKQPDHILSEMVNQLGRSVNDWRAQAKPIERYIKDYYHVAYRVLELARHLLGVHSKVDDSRKLFEMIQEEFAEVDDITVLAAGHLNAVELERIRSNVKSQGEKLRYAADTKQPTSILCETVNQFIRVVNEWKARAQPIQAYTKDYYHVAYLVFKLACDLLNKHGKRDESRKLFEMLQLEFAGVDEISARVAERLDTLETAETSRRRVKDHVEELNEVVHRRHYYPDLRPRVDQLIRAVKDWRDIAQPKKAYCGDYCNVAKQVLDLENTLWKKGRRCSSGKLRDMVQDKFGRIPEIETRLAEEAKAREETDRKHAQPSARKRVRWRWK